MTRLTLFAALTLAACVVPAQSTTPSPTPTPAVAPAADGSGDGSCSDDADVPGDRDQAVPVEPGTLAGCFGRHDDVDTFSLSAPAEGGGLLARVEVAGSPKLQPCAKVVAADGTEESDICAERDGAPATGWLHVAPGTTAILKVHPFVGFVGSRGYTLRIDEVPIADSDEPNDTREQATPLALGTPHQAFFSVAVNAETMTPDFYRVEVPSDGTMKVDVADADPKVWWFVKVFDAEGAEVNETSARGNGAPVHASAKVAKGVYFVELGNYVGRLKAAGNGAAPKRVTKPYTISATLQ